MDAKKNACRLSGVDIKRPLFTVYVAGVLLEDHGDGEHHEVMEAFNSQSQEDIFFLLARNAQ